MNQIKVLISCGSGIATSKHVAQKLTAFLEESGFEPKVETCSVNELSAKYEQYDILLTTAQGDFDFGKPIINAVPFITGIGEDEAKEQLLEEARKQI